MPGHINSDQYLLFRMFEHMMSQIQTHDLRFLCRTKSIKQCDKVVLKPAKNILVLCVMMFLSYYVMGCQYKPLCTFIIYIGLSMFFPSSNDLYVHHNLMKWIIVNKYYLLLLFSCTVCWSVQSSNLKTKIIYVYTTDFLVHHLKWSSCNEWGDCLANSFP